MIFTSTVSGKSSQNILSFKLYSKLCAANCFFSSSVVLMLPSVGLFSICKSVIIKLMYGSTFDGINK